MTREHSHFNVKVISVGTRTDYRQERD